MAFAVGIGIVTYNRRQILSDTIDRVRTFTRHPAAALVVADDGSSDGTLAMLREKQVPVITGANRGVAWNKNRALFLLSRLLDCETVILLEDDTQPSRAGWEAEWIDASKRWGHVNYAANWIRDHFESGTGTAADPVRCKHVTAQCAAYSRDSLIYGGYFDPRFQGYGHEHVEQTRRLIRVGYGGTDEIVDGKERVRYLLVKGDLTVVACKSSLDNDQVARNLHLARAIIGQQGYRAPWGEDRQLDQFRAEMQAAMSDGFGQFALAANRPVRATEPTAERGIFSRLFRRA
jgi:hypothetical protein